MANGDAKAQIVPLHRKQFNVDGWVNVLTAIGLKGRDKRLEGEFEAEEVTELEAQEMWAGSDMGARLVETVPGEMFRQGFDVLIEPERSAKVSQDPDADVEVNDPEKSTVTPPAGRRLRGAPRPLRGDRASFALPEEGRESDTKDAVLQAKELKAHLEELDALGAFTEAMEYQRAYGGGAILLGANDGASNLAKPLELKRVRSVDWLTVLSPRELKPFRWYTNPRKAKYGQVEVFRLMRSGAEGESFATESLVHESRLIVFQGAKVHRRQIKANGGWGSSIFTRVKSVLRDFEIGWDAGALLLSDFSQAVFKIKGLAELIAGNEDDVVVNRAKMIDVTRSICRAVLIDSEEDFDRKATPLAGLPEMLEKFSQRLAAAGRMPVTILMGMSPAGLNATGESDIRSWYDSIARERERVARPRLERLIQVVFNSKDGPTGGVEPANWSLTFPPLWQLTETEESEVRLADSQADKNWIDAGVLTPEEVARSRFGGSRYGRDVKLDREIREQFDLEADDEAEAEAKALQELAAQGAGEGTAVGQKKLPPGSKPPFAR